MSLRFYIDTYIRLMILSFFHKKEIQLDESHQLVSTVFNLIWERKNLIEQLNFSVGEESETLTKRTVSVSYD